MFARNRWGALLLLLALALVACTGTSDEITPAEGDAASAAPLRLAMLPVTDVIPFYVAQQEGYFEEEGVTVELIPINSAAERDTLIQTGEADGQLNDLVSTVLINANSDSQVRVVRQGRAAFPDLPQFYILSAPESGILSLDDLKGQEIGISENSVIAYITDRLLQLEGFSEEEIVTTNVAQIPTRLQLLMENQLPAAVLPDPLASLAMMQGAHLVLADSAHPEVSQSVISFRDEVLAERPTEVAALVRAYDRAVAAINADPAAYQNVLITNSRVPEPLQDQYQLPRFPERAIPSEAQFADVVQWALDEGIIAEPLSYEQLVDTSVAAQ